MDFLKYTLTVESSFTVMVTEAVAPEEVFAVMVVVPAVRPLIVVVVSGPAVTLATLVLPLYHVTVSELGVGAAVNVMVLLRPTSYVSPLIVTEPVVVLPPPALEPEGAPVTVIFAVAHVLSATEHAVILADPFFKPSTVPLFTDATVGSELVHFTA